MKVHLFGYGKMGQCVERIAEARDHTIVPNLEEADAAIDFSYAAGVLDHIRHACWARVPLIIGTTGWEEQLPAAKKWVLESGNAALFAPNFSLGVAYFRLLLKKAHELFETYAVAGVEYHHHQKQDAPSGTAKAIAEELQMPAPFSSVRCGSLIGKHEVLFDSPVETITLTHEAKNREGFALGAVQAAEWICDQTGWFTLDDMLHSTHHTL